MTFVTFCLSECSDTTEHTKKFFEKFPNISWSPVYYLQKSESLVSGFWGGARAFRHFPPEYELFVNDSVFSRLIWWKLQKLATAFNRFSKFLLKYDRGYSEKLSKRKMIHTASRLCGSYSLEEWYICRRLCISQKSKGIVHEGHQLTKGIRFWKGGQPCGWPPRGKFVCKRSTIVTYLHLTW